MKILGSWERREPGLWSSRTLSRSCSHPLFLCFSLPGTSISPHVDSPSPPAGDIVISSPSFSSHQECFLTRRFFFFSWPSGMWGLSSPIRAQTLSPGSGSALDSQGRPFTRHLYPREGLWLACLKSVSTPGPPPVPRRQHIVINQYWSHPLTWVHRAEKNDGKFHLLETNWRLLQSTLQMLVSPEF